MAGFPEIRVHHSGSRSLLLCNGPEARGRRRSRADIDVDSQHCEDGVVQVGSTRGDGIHDHDTTALLQIADTLDRESLPRRGTVLVPRAEQLDRGGKSWIAVVGKYLDLDAI